jgi:hypothetical protein
MRTIDRIERILGTSFDLDDIYPPVELKRLKDDEKFATGVGRPYSGTGGARSL